jgi:hypothetical protein
MTTTDPGAGADRNGKTPLPPEFFEEDDGHIDEKIRLSRDLIIASRALGAAEARYLVDAYYMTQENRKRTDNQVRSMGDEPGLLIRWMAEKNWTLEQQIARALKEYTAAHPMGDWMRAIRGIGPVLSAGFLAHIDMTHCPTVGHIWSFAGIAGPPQDLSNRRAAFRVTFKKLDMNDPPPLFLSNEQWATPYYPDGPNVYVYQVHVGTADAPEVVLNDNILEVEVLYKNTGQKPWQKGEKRPFNAQLKVLCWKTGQSFMKLSNRDDCYYGRTYRTRKEYEIANNESGKLATIAASQLPHFRPSTEAHKHYKEGRLPPAHIDARARRYAVKLFLSHLHGEWYRRLFNKEPPLPYPIAFMEHVHFDPGPNPSPGPGASL